MNSLIAPGCGEEGNLRLRTAPLNFAVPNLDAADAASESFKPVETRHA
ncbi:hypothetical protein PX554_06535 [Sphingomonas sp. H39-1-10]|nr:hypothetical protein [Sphingomonas pollutisoli]MDF0487781.1 hypothetical protein [Sphingomonas pollutisoli]